MNAHPHTCLHTQCPLTSHKHTLVYMHTHAYTHTHVGIPIKTLVLNRHDSISNSFLAITVKRRKGPHLWATDGLQVKRGKPDKSHHNLPNKRHMFGTDMCGLCTKEKQLTTQRLKSSPLQTHQFEDPKWKTRAGEMALHISSWVWQPEIHAWVTLDRRAELTFPSCSLSSAWASSHDGAHAAKNK